MIPMLDAAAVVMVPFCRDSEVHISPSSVSMDPVVLATVIVDPGASNRLI